MGCFPKGAEITLITLDLDNASEGKREYEAPGNTGAFFLPDCGQCNVISIYIVTR